jgi:hypothetical protein
MPRKPAPPPLSLLPAKIERETLAVMQRTEQRISQIGAVAAAQYQETSTLITLAFPLFLLLAYTAYTIYTKCECACAI